MMTVERGKALVLERNMARMATAMKTSMIVLLWWSQEINRQFHLICESSAPQIPMISSIIVQWITDST